MSGSQSQSFQGGGREGWAVHQGGEKIFVSFDNTGKILERTISD